MDTARSVRDAVVRAGALTWRPRVLVRCKKHGTLLNAEEIDMDRVVLSVGKNVAGVGASLVAAAGSLFHIEGITSWAKRIRNHKSRTIPIPHKRTE